MRNRSQLARSPPVDLNQNADEAGDLLCLFWWPNVFSARPFSQISWYFSGGWLR